MSEEVQTAPDLLQYLLFYSLDYKWLRNRSASRGLCLEKLSSYSSPQTLFFFPLFSNGFGHARIKKVSGMHETSVLTEGKATHGKYLWQGFSMTIHLLKPFAKRRDLSGQRWGKTICLLLKLCCLSWVPSWSVLHTLCFGNPGICGSAELWQQTIPLATVTDLKLISYHAEVNY